MNIKMIFIFLTAQKHTSSTPLQCHCKVLHKEHKFFFLKKYIVFICGLTQETFLILNIFPWYTPTIRIGSVFLAEVYKQIF